MYIYLKTSKKMMPDQIKMVQFVCVKIEKKKNRTASTCDSSPLLNQIYDRVEERYYCAIIIVMNIVSSEIYSALIRTNEQIKKIQTPNPSA